MSPAIETVLSMRDFSRYFEQRGLGKLYFPNGQCRTPHGAWVENADTENFFVHLHDLYKLVVGWKVNHTLVPLDDIIAVIAFGSAVRFPGVRQVPSTHRQYGLFGKRVTTTKAVPIQPNDADFLVVTGANLMREQVLAPVSLETYDSGTWITKGGIHLVNRGVGQLLKGAGANDTVGISALQEGIPVFSNGRFDELVAEAGIRRTTPRQIFWDQDKEGRLTGWIR